MAELDKIDREILRVLSQEGRISNIHLSERVGLSASASLRRVSSLEQSGVINGYRAVLNATEMGRGFLAYLTVGLSEHSKAAQTGFEVAVSRFDEVRECHNITGGVEYLLRVETADLAQFKHFHTEKLGTLPHVRQIESHVVLGSPKDTRG